MRKSDSTDNKKISNTSQYKQIINLALKNINAILLSELYIMSMHTPLRRCVCQVSITLVKERFQYGSGIPLQRKEIICQTPQFSLNYRF